MLYNYCPEMGEKEPTETTQKQVGHLTLIKQEPIEMTASIGHYSGWYVDTTRELKGQGIKLIRTGYNSLKAGGWVNMNTYKVTDRAFEKLKKMYNIKRESLLD